MGVSDTEDRDKDNKTSLKEERVIDTEDRDKNNETGLQEGGGIEMSNYSAFHIRDARSSLCIYLPNI